jgi:acetylornithine deacetylase
LLHGPTLNIGTIRGGDKVNMVADFCEFSVDFRFLPGMNPQAISREFRKIIHHVTHKFKVIVDDMQPPYEIDRQHPFVRTYLQAARSMGYPTTLKGSEGATVITFFQKKGIPAFATGYGSRGTAHTTDEYVKADNLYKGARLLEEFLKTYDQRTA